VAVLVNELVEARAANILSRALGRWERIELIGIDELGYVPLAESPRSQSAPAALASGLTEPGMHGPLELARGHERETTSAASPRNHRQSSA
jgi:hypothetical protein